MKTTRGLVGTLLFGTSLLVFVPVEVQGQDKAARCKAGYEKCMRECDAKATANTGKAPSAARVSYCHKTFCLPAMQQHSCPRVW